MRAHAAMWHGGARGPWGAPAACRRLPLCTCAVAHARPCVVLVRSRWRRVGLTRCPGAAQPKEIKDIRDFLQTVRRKDARNIKIKKAKNGSTKFKIRCSRVRRFVPPGRGAASRVPPLRSPWRSRLALCAAQYLYTLIVPEQEKADKLKQSLPPGARARGCRGTGRGGHDVASRVPVGRAGLQKIEIKA